MNVAAHPFFRLVIDGCMFGLAEIDTFVNRMRIGIDARHFWTADFRDEITHVLCGDPFLNT